MRILHWPFPPPFSLILPTYNERENLPIMVARLRDLLRGEAFEIIVDDDDSPDGTWEVARDLGLADPNIHLIRRIGRRGLTSAAVEGLLLAKGTYLAVMDADLQHDIELLAFAWFPVAWGHSWMAASALGIAVGVSWTWLVSRSFRWER